MTLSKLKQEGREEFEKNVNGELGCNWGMEEVENFINKMIEKAYSAGQHSMIPIAPKETVKKFKEGYQFLSKKEVRQIRLAALEDVEKIINRVIDKEANLIKDLRIVDSVALRIAKKNLNKVITKLKQSK